MHRPLSDMQHHRRTLVVDPHVWPDTIVVALAGVGPSSLDIEIVAWFATADYGELRACREEVLLGFLDVIEEAGTSVASSRSCL